VLSVKRLLDRPIISPAMLAGEEGRNIAFPSLIKVPEWVPGRLGAYYLYFGHHRGDYIRMAFADDIMGPWTIHGPGVLHLRNVATIEDHISAPDVIAVDEAKQIRMYFHGVPLGGGPQANFVAISADGLQFTPRPEQLGLFYFRVFEHRNLWYAMAKGGKLYRSRNGLTDFVGGQDAFPPVPRNTGSYNAPGSVRHVGLHRTGDVLDVYYTRIGDKPERILRGRMALSLEDRPEDWMKWRVQGETPILEPGPDWEGGSLPLRRSRAGQSAAPERALRDPFVYVEKGRKYLLYAVAGEQGIALAEIMESAAVANIG
jgi:hypothetical protein